MQKICDLGLFLKLPLASILMAKSVPSKPTQDIFALFYTCKSQRHLQTALGICWVFLGEYTIFFEAQLKSSGSLDISNLVFVYLFVGSFQNMWIPLGLKGEGPSTTFCPLCRNALRNDLISFRKSSTWIILYSFRQSFPHLPLSQLGVYSFRVHRQLNSICVLRTHIIGVKFMKPVYCPNTLICSTQVLINTSLSGFYQTASVGPHPNFYPSITISLATSDPFRSSQAQMLRLYIHSELRACYPASCRFAYNPSLWL